MQMIENLIQKQHSRLIVSMSDLRRVPAYREQ
jgi:hypothetical protein